MDRCYHCGGEIEFRYVNGALVPIHTRGTSCDGYRGKPYNQKKPDVCFDDLCQATTCPQCGEKVFFIRHNGGSVWVDELGWPWPKHECMDNANEPSWYLYFKKNNRHNTEEKLFSGVVVDAHWDQNTENNNAMIVLAIEGGQQGRYLLATEATTTADYLKGEIVIVNLKDREITISTCDVKPIIKTYPNPESTDLPINWIPLSNGNENQ